MVVYQKCIQVCFCEFRNDMSDGILNLSQKFQTLHKEGKLNGKTNNINFCIMYTFV